MVTFSVKIRLRHVQSTCLPVREMRQTDMIILSIIMKSLMKDFFYDIQECFAFYFSHFTSANSFLVEFVVQNFEK